MNEYLEFESKRIQGGDTQLLFIHGFGGNIDQPGVKWMMNRFLEGGFTITYIQLPTRIESFKKDILGPVGNVQRDLGDHVMAGFSLGGLTAAFLGGAKKRIFLSPFWGINGRYDFKGIGIVLNLLAGINKPELKRDFNMEDAGPLARKGDLEGIPEHIDPQTIYEMHDAQQHLPPPIKGDIAYYCPDDRIISIDAVKNRGIRTRTYRGGHMFYLSRKRKAIMNSIIDDLKDTKPS